MRADEFIIETTSSGGIAAVATGGAMISRYGNPSIYGERKKKKKKVREADKYMNSVKKD